MGRPSIIKEQLYQIARDLSPILTLGDVKKSYPDLSSNSLVTTLLRMQDKGEVFIPWKGVYIISPEEYFGRYDVHASEYIDVIMRYTRRGYYVALQDAISELIPSYYRNSDNYHLIVDGMTNPNGLGKTTPPLSLCYSKATPYQYIYDKETKYGKVNISTAELTAIDLISYVNAVGGLQESVNALKVLSSKLNFRRLKEDIFEYRSIANIQRLGYIIEYVLAMPAKAKPLHDLLDKRYKTVYARHKLQSSGPVCVNINKRWNIDVNIDLNLCLNKV